MKFEEVLPALRKGKKIRRKSWKPEEYIILITNDPEYGAYITNEKRGKQLYLINLFWIHDDDWEIVPEPKKFEAWVNLYSDGGIIAFRSQDEAAKFRSRGKLENGEYDYPIECRKIEWEVGE